MVFGFFRYLAKDGFYWAVLLVGLISIAMNDNSFRTAFYTMTFNKNYELVYFDGQGKA